MSLKITSNTINYNVATVDDLTSIATPSINDTVVVTDENRGGVFIYRPTGVANGGTIFDSSSTGKWYRQYSGAVDVKWFDPLSIIDIASDEIPSKSETVMVSVMRSYYVL